MKNQEITKNIVESLYTGIIHRFDEIEKFLNEAEMMVKDYEESKIRGYDAELDKLASSPNYDEMHDEIMEKKYWYQYTFPEHLWFSILTYQYSFFDSTINRIYRLYCRMNNLTTPKNYLDVFKTIKNLSMKLGKDLMPENSEVCKNLSMLRIIRNSIAHSGSAQLKNYIETGNETNDKHDVSYLLIPGNKYLAIERLSLAIEFVAKNKKIIKMESDFTLHFGKPFCTYTNQLFRQELINIYNSAFVV